jgi:hypothetical protein
VKVVAADGTRLRAQKLDASATLVTGNGISAERV